MATSQKRVQKSGIQCAGCGSCCEEPVIPLNHDDVKQITKAAGLPVEQVVKFLSFDDVDWPKDAEDWIELEPGRRLMTLRKSRGKCMFLKNKRCEIYENRPRVCMVFPVDFKFSADMSRMSAKVQSRVDECRAWVQKKPRSNEKLAAIARSLFRSDLAYFKKVARWNVKNPRGSIDDYLRYLKLK